MESLLSNSQVVFLGRCLVDQWFDGLKCVNRTQCPCMVGHITYEVGSVFEKEDCSECICKLGGVSHCTPKHCAPCKEGTTSLKNALFPKNA